MNESNELKVLSATAMKAVLTALTPAIERATACTLSVAYATSGGVAKRIAGGEVADLAIIAATEMSVLAERGRVIGGSTVEIARSNIGVGVRKGAPKPDISSTASFTQALIAAHTVAYTDPVAGGASGTYLAGLLARLGIADRIATRLAAGGPDGLVGTIVARGDAEIGLHQIPELIAAGVDVVGPLPPELQQPTAYRAGILATARQQGAAKTLLGLLTAAPAIAAIRAEGMAAG